MMEKQKRGRFVTLEGIEGAGKSTAAQFARDWLASQGIGACLTREPGGTPLAERIRGIVLEPSGEPIPAEAETLLMFAARSIHLASLIRPALARGEWVICDRFTDATRAYQGGARGIASSLIEQLAAAVHGDIAPDCTLLLDLPVAEGLRRARSRAGKADRFEQEREAFFERVRQAYLELARREPRRIRLIDASRRLDEVQREIERALQELR
ncbi:MAG TPA: dTMP kinase [Steroidobacteraceae bacterium]